MLTVVPGVVLEKEQCNYNFLWGPNGILELALQPCKT